MNIHRIASACLMIYFFLVAVSGAAVTLKKLDQVPAPGYVDRVPSPDTKSCLFYRFKKGEPAIFG